MKIFRSIFASGLIACAGLMSISDSSVLAEAGTSPAVVKKKILVIYYSRSGNTKKVAEDIAKKLGADIEQLVDKKDRSGAIGYLIAGKDAMNENLTELEPVTHDPSRYDITIIGTPIWSWDMTPAVRTYILAHKSSFKDVAFFTTAGGTKPDKIVKKMETLSGKPSKAYTGFFESDLDEKSKTHYADIVSSFVENINK